LTKVYESSNGNTATWANARAACQARQMKLAIPMTDEENKAIRKASKTVMRLWIGISDGTGVFTDTDNNELLYNNWAAGEPNGITGLNCVMQWPKQKRLYLE